jgi:HKD family nuclease
VEGLAASQDAFFTLAERNAPVQILTTTYIGATDLNAILELYRLANVRLRISLDGRRRRLHAKAWLFQRDNGFSSVYVGSANLSGPALGDGIEWTVKLSEIESPQIVGRFRGAFESLWCDEEFEEFGSDDEEMHRRVRHALDYARRSPGRPDSSPRYPSIWGLIHTSKPRSINWNQNVSIAGVSETL